MTVDLTKGCSTELITECGSLGVLRNQLAYILATAEWETAHTMEPVKEAYWLSEDWRKDNLTYYPWYGRGLVQLTWEENYARADDELGLCRQLTEDPDLALDHDIAVSVIIQGMIEGWFTGKKLEDYITLEKSDFVGARHIINGTDCATEIASLAYEYDTALLDSGYGVDTPGKLPHIELPLHTGYLRKMLEAQAAINYDLTARIEALEAQHNEGDL